MDLKERWESIVTNAGLTGDAHSVYQKLSALYMSPNRSYHNFDHIEACLKELDSHEPEIDNRCLELAIWFHDSIYDPSRKDNEEKSAEFAKKVVGGVGQRGVDLIESLILITKHDSMPKTLEEKLMIDIDLSILGQPYEVFQKYDEGIRLEYNFVPQKEYLMGRILLLKSFLSKANIFHTYFFKELYEKQAKQNLHKKIDELDNLSAIISI